MDVWKGERRSAKSKEEVRWQLVKAVDIFWNVVSGGWDVGVLIFLDLHLQV